MIKDAVRKILPARVWSQLQSARAGSQLDGLERAWKAAREKLAPASLNRHGLSKVLIIPSDPQWITGSCGDEAMIHAIKSMARAVNPNVDLYVLINGPQAVEVAAKEGMTPLDLWSRGDFVGPLAAALREHDFSAVVAMGADIIDGFYGTAAPSRLLVAVDIAARLGIPAAVLGASFSTTPDRRLKPFFDGLHPSVHLCIRDAVSLERCKKFTSAQCELVADSAFMLKAPEPDQEVRAWVENRRGSGRTVIGFNVHPMLLRNSSDDPEALLIEPGLRAIVEVSRQRNVSWLLIPHDRREDCGDNSVLAPLFSRLKESLGDDVRFFGGHRAAAELKAIAGAVDGVVTGRMHLAIGALGAGTPVMCVTYQDKFEGLLEHFDLPAQSLLSLEELNDTPVAVAKMITFIDSVADLRGRVASQKPSVLALSQKNFALFREPETS